MKKKSFQSYNKKIDAYVSFKKMPNGKVKITNVKESKPMVPFKGIRIKKRK